MGFLDRFIKKNKVKSNVTKVTELGAYYSRFYSIGPDIYDSELVRSCVRPLADLTSIANARCGNKEIERLLNYRPNQYMSGSDFLYKLRTMYELRNNAFIYIERNRVNEVVSFYPVPYQSFEAVESGDNLFIMFHFANNTTLALPWDDLVPLRKDYYLSDYAGADNSIIRDNLETVATTKQGISNAIKSTANLRGILKSTKGMLDPEDIKAQKDRFVNDYMSLENRGGIASLDSTQEFTPIKMDPIMASDTQMKELREDVYRFFGVNEKVIMGTMTPEETESFYDAKIKPFLVLLTRQLNNKLFLGKALAYATNWIAYEANKLQFASLDKKISIFKDVVLYGGMTINEWRQEVMNMDPIDGGDELVRRLDAAIVEDSGTTDDSETGGEE